MDPINVTTYVLNRLWLLSKAEGLSEFEFKGRAEELLFLYSKLQNE